MTDTLQELLKGSYVAPALPNLADCLARNELGDAELFAAMFAGRYVYDPIGGDWWHYIGPQWEKDTGAGKVSLAVGNQIAAQYTQAAALVRAQTKDQNDRMREGDFLARAAALRSKRRVSSALDWAAKLLHLPPAGWDKTPLILTCENAVIDLATGKAREAAHGEYLRSCAPVQWLGLEYPAPLWEKTIREIFGGDEEMTAFIQRLFGYTLLGIANERILPIFYGTGANGKTTLIETLSAVLGADYCLTTSANALMENKNDTGDRPNPLIVAMKNKRLVWASESKEGQRLDMGLVKAMTGGDTLSARQLYSGEYVAFRPTHTAFLITNALPHVSADDQAAWDRILAVEFASRFVDAPQKPNEYPKIANLKDRLRAELPGVLAWLVRGCLEYQQSGLNPPAKVRQKSAEYRENEDDFGLFCNENLDTSDPDALTSAMDLYGKYRVWALNFGLSPMSGTAFGRRMGERYQKVKTKKGAFYQGVK